jgi:hypothetical protein
MWTKSEGSEDDLQRVVDEGIADVSPDVLVPVSTHEPDYVVNDPNYLHLVTPFPLKVFLFQPCRF